MATISARKITESSIAESLSTAATGGDSFINSGLEFVKIVNDHASNHYKVTFTPTVSSVKSPRYGTVSKSAVTVVVTDATEAYIGPFKQEVWNDTDNKISMAYAHSTGSGSSDGTAIGSGAHLLKVEVLYLDFK